MQDLFISYHKKISTQAFTVDSMLQFCLLTLIYAYETGNRRIIPLTAVSEQRTAILNNTLCSGFVVELDKVSVLHKLKFNVQLSDVLYFMNHSSGERLRFYTICDLCSRFKVKLHVVLLELQPRSALILLCNPCSSLVVKLHTVLHKLYFLSAPVL